MTNSTNYCIHYGLLSVTPHLKYIFMFEPYELSFHESTLVFKKELFKFASGLVRNFLWGHLAINLHYHFHIVWVFLHFFAEKRNLNFKQRIAKFCQFFHFILMFHFITFTPFLRAPNISNPKLIPQLFFRWKLLIILMNFHKNMRYLFNNQLKSPKYLHKNYIQINNF